VSATPPDELRLQRRDSREHRVTRTGGNRFPAAPAQEALRGFGRAHVVTIDDLAAVLGVDRRLVTSVMARRWLPWHLADTVAVALRRHPCDLWPDWFAGRPSGGGGRIAGSPPLT
jgi:hypothetical protein